MYLSSASSRLLLYDTNSWDLKKSYGCYEGIIRDISWSDDSKYLLQVNSKGVVEILTAAEHDVQSLQHIPIKDTWSASFHREGHRNVAIGTKSGNVLIWDTKNKTITKTLPSPPQQSCVNLLSYNARNTTLAATMQNGDTIIYGLVSNIPVLTVKLPCSKGITAMKFHHKSRSILGLATDEGHIVLRDITTNKDKVFFENTHASIVSDFAYSLINKDVLLSSGFDKAMNVYDVRLQNVVSSKRTPQPLTSVTINTDNQVALGTRNGIIIVYDLRDLTLPLKTLKGHDEEVSKVAFQPARKKIFSNEISLREHNECSFTPRTPVTPNRNRTSDIFFILDSPTNNLSNNGNNSNCDPADSFLVMMGLDKTGSFAHEDNKSDCNEKQFENNGHYNQHKPEKKSLNKISTPLHAYEVDPFFPSPIIAANGIPDDGPPSTELGHYNQHKHEKKSLNKISTPLHANQVDPLFPSPIIAANGIPDDGPPSAELFHYYQHKPEKKSLNKISTPLHANQVDPLFPSPIIAANGIPDDGRSPSTELVNVRQLNHEASRTKSPSSNIDNKVIDDLKDFIKLTVSDVADDSRDYFLHIMMELTKQKLYLEKQMAGLNEEIKSLANNQMALVETNRQLAYQIEQLKAQKPVIE